MHRPILKYFLVQAVTDKSFKLNSTHDKEVISYTGIIIGCTAFRLSQFHHASLTPLLPAVSSHNRDPAGRQAVTPPARSHSPVYEEYHAIQTSNKPSQEISTVAPFLREPSQSTKDPNGNTQNFTIHSLNRPIFEPRPHYTGQRHNTDPSD